MKVAIIPARGGSKRIPRKNIRPFAGQPMIAYAIRGAQAAGVFDHIVVSTDDDEIASVAESFGAEVPFRRPRALADDVTGTTAVVAHAVGWCRDHGWDVDYACCIYATVPLIQARHLREALDKLLSSGKMYCFPVASFPAPIQRALKLTPQGIEMFEPAHLSSRSQDLTPAFHDSGQFYWGTAQAWLEQRNIFSHDATAIVLPRHAVQDIDTEEDWTFAEKLYALLQERSDANV
jgi:pseudaminic acid cytidylyltransferase